MKGENNMKLKPELVKKYIEYVEKDGFNLEYVPKKYRTEQVCKVAVEDDGAALMFVPKKLRTEEICEIALRNDMRAIGDVPKRVLTTEFAIKIVTEIETVFNKIPDKYRSLPAIKEADRYFEEDYKFTI